MHNLLQQHFWTYCNVPAHYFVHLRRTKSKQIGGIQESRNSKFHGASSSGPTLGLYSGPAGDSQRLQTPSCNSTNLWLIQWLIHFHLTHHEHCTGKNNQIISAKMFFPWDHVCFNNVFPCWFCKKKFPCYFY